MSTDLRMNSLLDAAFDPQPRITTMTAPIANGHHTTNRLTEHLAAPAGGGLAGLVDQLAEVDPAELDREIAALDRRLSILKNLRQLIGTGGTPAPKDEGTAVPTSRPLHALIRVLAARGPLRSSEMCRAAGMDVKQLSRVVDPKYLRKLGPDRLSPWGLTPAGIDLARTKLKLTVIVPQVATTED